MWIVLGLLILALGGFGIGNFGGSLRTVATVGDAEVTVDDYARALRQEQQRLSQQTGQALTLDQLRTFGIDAQVMRRLLTTAALAHEAGALGVSVGDAAVAERVRAEPAFQGASGAFDRETYAFVLRNAGLDERTYEAGLRDEAAARLLQVAAAGGVVSPAGYAETMATYLAETRDVTLFEVGTDALKGTAPAPDEADLAAFHEAEAALFETPERRRITYAWADPDALAAETPVAEGELRALYDARAELYVRPRRVLAERLAYADEAAAEAALAAIRDGERTFEQEVADRGLTLADVDQGELAEADLPPEAAQALSALDGPGVVGPVPTPLGPALYRVNAVLAESTVPFEDAREDLAVEAAADAARRAVDAAREDIDDLLAGGATLEELAAETIMTLGDVAYDRTLESGIAAYPAFRAAAEAVEPGDFPELIELSDGGLLALRLDAVEPAALPPLDDVRAEVEAAWLADALADRLTERAEALADGLRAGEAATGLTASAVTDIPRDGTVEGLPPEAVAAIFDADRGDVLAVEGDETRAFVVRLDAIDSPLPTDERVTSLVTAIQAQTAQELSSDLFTAYGAAIGDAVGFTIDQGAVQAVQAQLLGGGG